MAIAKYFVYALFAKGDADPFYIGKGSGDRLAQHRSAAQTGKHTGPAIEIRRIWETKKEFFAVELVENLTQQIAWQIEKDLIQIIGRKPVGPLINVSKGGNCGWGRKIGHEVSIETRAKLRAANLGKPMLPQTRAALAAAPRPPQNKRIGDLWRDKPMPPEFRAKLSAAADRRWTDPLQREQARITQTGKVASDETRAKMSASHNRRALLNMSPRATARRLGLARYMLSDPCPYGHIGEHFTRNGACVECTRERWQ